MLLSVCRLGVKSGRVMSWFVSLNFQLRIASREGLSSYSTFIQCVVWFWFCFLGRT